MEFAEIFTQMGWLPAVLLAVGLVLLAVEMFVPGFGFFGVTGSISLIAGVVVRICCGLNLAQSLILILMVLGAMWLGLTIMIISAKYGFLSVSGLFESKSTLPANYNKVEKTLKKLVGKSGKTVTKLSMAGKAKIRGKIYNVVSINSYIEPNTNIKVVGIKDNNIMVRKWFE